MTNIDRARSFCCLSQVNLDAHTIFSVSSSDELAMVGQSPSRSAPLSCGPHLPGHVGNERLCLSSQAPRDADVSFVP